MQGYYITVFRKKRDFHYKRGFSDTKFECRFQNVKLVYKTGSSDYIRAIELQTNISCDILYLLEHIINESDLNTLLADLLENAYIATKYNNGHCILLTISIISNIYTISIFDSGIPFATEVLEKWGLEQITTHQKDGGSGIGMVTTHELLQKYNASFIIHEFGTNNPTYAKQISISFNRRNQYILHTKRPENELSSLSRRADLLIIRQ